jgi:molybdopterin converting factor small subunit
LARSGATPRISDVATSPIPRVTVRYWASARAAAGVAEEQLRAATLADLLAALHAAGRPRLDAVLAVASLVVDERPVGRRDPAAVRLADGATVEVLPPFAGG